MFEDDVVLFSFPGSLLTNPKSKVLGGIDMAQSDLDEIEYYLNSYCKSFIDISSYLK